MAKSPLPLRSIWETFLVRLKRTPLLTLNVIGRHSWFPNCFCIFPLGKRRHITILPIRICLESIWMNNVNEVSRVIFHTYSLIVVYKVFQILIYIGKFTVQFKWAPKRPKLRAMSRLFDFRWISLFWWCFMFSLK